MKTVTELLIRADDSALLGPELVANRLRPAAAALPLVPFAEAPAAPPPSTAVPPATPRSEAPKKFQRGPIPSEPVLRALLIKHKGVVADIAKEMQRSRAQIYRWLEDRHLDPTSFRS